MGDEHEEHGMPGGLGVGGLPGGLGGMPVGGELGPGGIYMAMPQQQVGNAHQYLQSPMTKKDRSFGDRAVYETGVLYSAGMIAGGSYGVFQGMRKPIGSGGKTNFKLRLNAVLNASGKLGSSTANSLGVFAMTYSFARSFCKYERKKNDIYNDIVGITVAGALGAAPKGPVAGAVAGLTLGGLAGAILYSRLKAEEILYAY